MRSIGDLRARIALMRRVVETGGGTSRERWETIGLYAAEVAHLSAKTVAQAGADWVDTLVLVHVRTPRTFSLQEGMRVDHLGTAYEVTEVVPDKPFRGISELRCRRLEMRDGTCGT